MSTYENDGEKTQHSLCERDLHELTTGGPVTSLTPFASPLDEYCNAFADRTQKFLNYYSLEKDNIQKYSLTRGEFWDLACSAAAYLADNGIAKGDRVVHCFSCNMLCDLAFRFAAVLLGCVPVTINWQADENDLILYKAKVTEAKVLLFDVGMASRVEEMRSFLTAQPLSVGKFESYQARSEFSSPTIGYEDERIIVFTSGTTSRPKGVSLPHRSYLANRLTFEGYLNMAPTTQLDLLIVNPLHHTNSTALSDWGMRRRGAIIHLIERYSTAYWKILVEVASRKRGLLVASLVPRHFDFLETLSVEAKLPVEEAKIKEALTRTDILIGSAPVGPTTIKRILMLSGRLPHARFGSTETCLEVMATPFEMSTEELMKAFEAGWSHWYQGEPTAGYYIGREHYPFTRIKLVKSIDPESEEYFKPCEVGEPGYLVTQGPNVMNHYVGQPEATKAAFREGWYTGLKDIAFCLRNEEDGHLDYYWSSRDSELLVRGGAKYAYDQVAASLSRLVTEQFGLKSEQFQLAVVSLRLESEHEDSCCVTIELKEESSEMEAQLAGNFLKKAQKVAPKGSKPDYLRFARIPRSFKGAILYPQLRQEFLNAFKEGAVCSVREE